MPINKKIIKQLVYGLCLTALSNLAFAAGFQVNTNSDFDLASASPGACISPGVPCSVRAAVELANQTPGFDTVYILATTHYLSIESLITISDSLAIRGINKTTSKIRPDPGLDIGIFEITNQAFASMSNLTLSHAYAKQGAGTTGAIYVTPDATLYASDINLIQNVAWGHLGPGILNDGGYVSLHKLYAKDNGMAPGLFDYPNVYGRNRGGVIATIGEGAETWIDRSTFENSDAMWGGAVYMSTTHSEDGGLPDNITVIKNSSFINNITTNDGAGGAILSGGSDLYIVNSNIDGPVGNLSLPAPIYTVGNNATMVGGSVLSGYKGNFCSSEPGSFFVSMGGNVLDSLGSSDCLFITNNDVVGTKNLKEVFQQTISSPSGSFTPTVKPNTVLPWTGTGSSSAWFTTSLSWIWGCPSVDQTGYSRSANCDSGPYEDR